MWDLINYNVNVKSENDEKKNDNENVENAENVERGESGENAKQNESLNINLVENAVDITNTLYEQVRNNNTAFWSMLGYEENPNQIDPNIQNQEEEPYTETIQDEGENKKEKDHEPIDDTQNDSLEEMERVLEENAKAKIEKKKKREKKTERLSKNKLDINHIFESNNGISKSPFFSDISSYADYYTSGEENSENKEKNKSDEVGENKEKNKSDEIGESGKENSNESNNSENDVTPATDSVSNDWFFSKIKEIIEPNINQETINQLLSNNYNSFSEANTGLYGLIDKVIRTNNSNNNNYENMSIINKQSHHGNIYDHYNSMDVSPNDNYNFINYSIYCINKELSANVEMEAIKMMKIYAHTFNKFKKDINYKDDLYKDLLNEAEEQSTIILKNNRKKRILKIDFLNLANMNSENYNNIIDSQNVQTPKIKLEDIFKISVN